MAADVKLLGPVGDLYCFVNTLSILVINKGFEKLDFDYI